MSESEELEKLKAWTDEQRGKYIDSFDPDDRQKERTCGMCGGTHLATRIYTKDVGQVEEEVICLHEGTAQVLGIDGLLSQSINHLPFM